jgi:hypothetical protein
MCHYRWLRVVPAVFVNRTRGVASEWVRIGAGTIGS